MLKGIDVSVWQGNIDWSKVAKNIDFAILRAGYGSSSKDKKFEQNYIGCQSNNIPKGVYWYNYAKNITAAKAEANACLDILKGKNIEFPVWYDIEENTTFQTGKNNVSAIAKTFCDTIAAAGYMTGIYSSKSGLQSYFTDEVKNKYDIWLASVGKNGAILSSNSYSGKYDMWQYSWKGRINGISGDVDLDYCYKDYLSKEDKKEIMDKNDDINIFYQVYNGKKWYPLVKNDTDFAGVEGKTISGFAAKADMGELKYRVHLPNGRWLNWINDFNITDWNNGVAGIKGKSIDGLQIIFNKQGYKILYRASLVGYKQFLPWIEHENDYAGVFGKLIDKIQIKIIKE